MVESPDMLIDNLNLLQTPSAAFVGSMNQYFKQKPECCRYAIGTTYVKWIFRLNSALFPKI